jgi:hypothetical protein
MAIQMAGNIRNPYRSGGSSIEIDLREEMEQLLYGSAGEIAKGKKGLLRKMRRDSEGELIRCPCRNKVTDEPDRDSFCRYCHGHGYFWDEYEIVYYKNDDSFRTIEGKVQEYKGDMFFFQYFEDLSPSDFIIELALDNDGAPEQPVQRLKVYDIISADQFRADYGRVEFWQVRAKFQRKWSVWYGVKNRQYN